MVLTDNALIIRKTLELCQTILDQPEFRTVRLQVDAFMADEASQAQLQQLQEKGDTLQHKQQMGVPLSGEEINEFEEQRAALLGNPVAKGFLEAQEAVHQIQSAVGRYVSKTFELGRLPSSDDFESGSCGEGCGCHH